MAVLVSAGIVVMWRAVVLGYYTSLARNHFVTRRGNRGEGVGNEEEM
jgi:hypothetical protein